MGDAAHADEPVAIFCGGNHVRLGRLAAAQAKALLVAYDTPLLWRLIDQLRDAGFRRIVAATTPRLERAISDSLSHYTRAAPAGFEVRLTARVEQERGLLYGLRAVLGDESGERLAICLGDIFFLGNPFPALRAAGGTGIASHLVVAPATLPAELTRGGIVRMDGERVGAVIERPMAAPPPGARRWSGAALLPRASTLADLEAFLAGSSGCAPPGDLLQHQCQRGRALRLIEGPDFVNVNSPDQLLLASLYARLEKEDSPGAASAILEEAARALRAEIARGPAREPA